MIASDHPSGELRYHAFISYSHVNEGAARRLHRWLETYRIPARAVGKTTARGPVPRRLSPIFRDRSELPASASLDQLVKTALSESASLIVLCSPAAKASRWVDSEIAWFRSKHPDRPVVAGLLDGGPDDAFPGALTEAGPDGVVQEPVAADFQKEGDGARLARLKIVAGITGLPLDELVRRETQRQLRRVTAITAFAVLSALVLGLLLVAAINARNQAEQQRQQAEGLIEFMLTDLRTRLQGVGRLDILSAVNERALAYYGEQGDLASLPGASLERRARVLHAMGADDQKRGDLDAALGKFLEAHRVTATLLADSPDDPDRIYAHAQSEFWLGYVDFGRQRYAAALPRFEAYRALAARLADIDPRNPDYMRELGYAEGNLCSLSLSSPNMAARGLRACGNALAAMQAVERARPGDAGVKSDLANRHAWMADAYKATGRMAEALAERRRQAALVDWLVKADPMNASYRQDWVLARFSIAALLKEMGETDRAQTMAREAGVMIDRLIATDPENQDWRSWRDKIDTTFPHSTQEVP